MTAAEFFVGVQRAPYYEQMFRTAIEQLPPGDGRRWLDVGCGPGLLTRRAAERGYDATGIDPDPDRIAAARRANRGGADVLRLRAAGREGHTVEPSLVEKLDGVAGLSVRPLVHGLVAGWVIRRVVCGFARSWRIGVHGLVAGWVIRRGGPYARYRSAADHEHVSQWRARQVLGAR